MPLRKLFQSRRDSVVGQPGAELRTFKGKPSQARSAIKEEEDYIPYFRSAYEEDSRPQPIPPMPTAPGSAQRSSRENPGSLSLESKVGFFVTENDRSTLCEDINRLNLHPTERIKRTPTSASSASSHKRLP